MKESDSIRPWHKEPFVWMIISLPLASVIGGIITIFLAVASDDGLVADDYYKRGLEVNRVLERDINADSLGLSANVNVNSNILNIALQGNEKFAAPESLRVSFLHPTRKNRDHILLLKRTRDTNYTGDMPVLDGGGRWYLLIESQEWRLLLDYRVKG
ncbi:MAG: FixH family protein [Gammaproteobacteria bacterium]